MLLNLIAVSFYLGWRAALTTTPTKGTAILRHVSTGSSSVINNVRSAPEIRPSQLNSTKSHSDPIAQSRAIFGPSPPVALSGARTEPPSSGHSSTRPRPYVILATTNNAFLDFTENWIKSLERSGVTDHVTIITEDVDTHEALLKRNHTNLEILLTGEINLPGGDLAFGSEDYLRLVNKRPRYILRYLQEGTDVLFTDVDTVWLQDPLPFFVGDYDLYFERDIYDNKTKPDMICAGFAYYSATNATIDLINKWIQLIQAKPKIPDQQLLNQLLRRPNVRKKLKVKFLDQRQFPNGRDYFNPDWREKHADFQQIVVHNNWIKGHDIKIERFKNASMWYL